MIKRAIAITVALMAQITFMMAQVPGDPLPIILESKLDVFHRVPLPNNEIVTVRSIDVPANPHGRPSTWIVSGLINFYGHVSPGDHDFIGASITEGSPALSVDGTGLFYSTQSPGNLTNGLSIPGKEIIVPAGGATIYLVGWSYQPVNPTPLYTAWGYITAQKVQD